MATQPIIVPDLGDFANVDVIEVLVKAGDSVKKEDSLITLETDKASMDVPAPADGVIATLTVKVGDKVSAGDTIGTLDSICQRWLIENALETGSDEHLQINEHSSANLDTIHDHLRRILSDETVDVQVTDTDRYGREVAYLFSDGLDINLSQIENGAAWHYTSIAKKQQPKADFASYAAAEAYARAERTGLWAKREPLAPWLFRKQQHTAQPQ